MPGPVAWHPTASRRPLTGNKRSFVQARLSKNRGVTFTTLESYVRRCLFADAVALAVDQPHGACTSAGDARRVNCRLTPFGSEGAWITQTAMMCHVDDEGGVQSAYHTHSIYRSTNAFVTSEQIATDVVEFVAFQKFVVYGKVPYDSSAWAHARPPWDAARA